MTNVLLEKKGHIAVATINRPKALNALNSQVLEDIDQLVERVKADDEIRALIENDRKQLFGSFCRACGYCMPCPAGIEINTCARMSLLLRRSPSHLQLTPEVQAKMMKIKDCLHCGHCMSKCPYGLNTPELLQRNLKDYEEILAGKEILPGNF